MSYTIYVDFGRLSESEYETYATKKQALAEIKRLVNENIYDRDRLDIVIGE